MIYDIYAVGNTLRSIRNKYGYTQNDMAESLDVSYIHYSQIEQGRHRMSLELMLKIVTKYGAQICSLASLAAIISVNSCRGLYYQPEEPDGVRKIAKKK